MLGTVTRAGALLDLFTPGAPEWGPTAAARELGVAKSQAHELLTSLSAIGLLRRGPGGQFRLGWRTLSLGRELLRSQFPTSVFGVVASLSRAFQEPVQLAAFDRNRLTPIAMRAGRSGTDALVPDSLDDCLHACALGKVLLAELSDPQLELALPSLLPRFTASTIVAPCALVIELAGVREERIAFDRGEIADGLRSVAVPIHDGSHETVASLGIWCSAERWAAIERELTRGVVGAGRRIESLMRAASADRAPSHELAAADAA